ncbi:MAG: hypothetical protein G3M78_08010 [Candidatus Nitrohelix vancouverensis]|uniref:Uncharacterized protein n=1 Tax=Candidatus Nitrohelix vancouverensis TaxID=2705534 RepID=A0A7T0C2G5_9BACT|nr:MAG: hypothetical protein G3M78_08010 [Candidatus Nitrohelix vancouverensis]
MDYSLLNLLSPFIGLAVNLAVQVASYRLIARLALLQSLFVGCGAGWLGLGLFEGGLLTATDRDGISFAAQFVVNSTIYFLLAYNYFHFINMGETARRIRILRELHESENGLSQEEILERYNAQDMIRLRMQRLLNNGQIIQKGGRYYIANPTVLRIAQCVTWLKWIMLGKRSEFE